MPGNRLSSSQLRLFIKNKCDEFQIALAGVSDAVPLAGSNEGDVSRADREESTVVVILALAAKNVICLAVAVVYMPAEAAAGCSTMWLKSLPLPLISSAPRRMRCISASPGPPNISL